MPDWEQINRKLDYGRGKESAVLGPPFDVYRLNSGSSGNPIAPGNKIYSGIKCAYKPNPTDIKQQIEYQTLPGVIFYDVRLDVTQYDLKLGDIFVLSDPLLQDGRNRVTYSTEDLNAFFLAQASPGMKVIGIRLNKVARILRGSKAPLETEIEGPDGTITIMKSWSPDSTNAYPLILANGQYTLSNDLNAEGVRMPVMLFPVSRPYGDKEIYKAPAVARKSAATGFAPPMPGFNFKEGDRLQTVDDVRYVVVSASYQETGLVGTYLFLERETPG